MEKMKLDGRLGFSLDVSREELDILRGNDRAAARQLLVKLVQSEHCLIVGDTYFPPEWNEDVLDPIMREESLTGLDMEDNLGFDLPVLSYCGNKYHIAERVGVENLKNGIELLGYEPGNYTDDELREILLAYEDSLAGDDIYQSVCNEMLFKTVEAFEKQREGSLDDKIVNATERSVSPVHKEHGKVDERYFS